MSCYVETSEGIVEVCTEYAGPDDRIEDDGALCCPTGGDSAVCCDEDYPHAPTEAEYDAHLEAAYEERYEVGGEG